MGWGPGGGRHPSAHMGSGRWRAEDGLTQGRQDSSQGPSMPAAPCPSVPSLWSLTPSG